MGHTLYFLTATWLAAQGVDAPVVVYDDLTPAACTSCQEEAAEGSWHLFGGDGDGDRPGLLRRLQERLSGLIHRITGWDDEVYDDDCWASCCGDDCWASCCGDGIDSLPPSERPPTMPYAQLSEPPLADARQAVPKADPLSAINFQPAPASQRSLSPGLADKVGHENDYSRVTGQIHLDNGRWSIRYATPETVDRHGGSLRIAPGANMSNLRDGDLVTIHGHVADGAYHASSVELIEHEAN